MVWIERIHQCGEKSWERCICPSIPPAQAGTQQIFEVTAVIVVCPLLAMQKETSAMIPPFGGSFLFDRFTCQIID